MFGSPKRLCLLLVLGVFVAPALSGCASSGEPTLASAVAHSGVVDGVIGSLKEADDEREVERKREEAPQSPQEQEETHDEHEQVAMEATEAAAGDTYEPTGE